MVELIITVVILAIIIAVAIAGITSNIKKARINTDINNASTIQKAISTLSLDKELIDKFSTIEEGTKLAIKWEDAQSIKDNVLTPSDSKSEQALVDERIPSELINKIQGLLPDGLPASQTGEPFYIVIEKGSGNEISYKTISLAGSSSEGSNGGNSSNSGSTSIPPIIASHTHEITITKDVKPTCTEEGQKISKCNNCDYTTTETLESLGHDYSTATYTWASNGTTCSAKRICSNNSNHIETEQASITSAVTTPATCTTKGTTTYTAKFNNTAFSNQTKSIQNLDILGHNFSTTYTVDTPATCTTAGTKSRHCTRCSATTDSISISATGVHEYGNQYFYNIGSTYISIWCATIYDKCNYCSEYHQIFQLDGFYSKYEAENWAKSKYPGIKLIPTIVVPQ